MAAAKARRIMNPYGHSDDEDEYLGKNARNGGARRFNLASRIDLTKLEPASLQRYRKAYKLPEHTANGNELLQAIVRHFANVYVDEDETLIRFAIACRRNGQRMGLGVKKSRTGSVKPRGGR